jgi:predicted RNA-binding Zn-ribbon protein involved in translation (DUF1610 family)
MTVTAETALAFGGPSLAINDPGNTRTGASRNVRGRRRGQLQWRDDLLIRWRMLLGLRLMYRGRSTAQIHTVTPRSHSRPLKRFRLPADQFPLCAGCGEDLYPNWCPIGGTMRWRDAMWRPSEHRRCNNCGLEGPADDPDCEAEQSWDNLVGDNDRIKMPGETTATVSTSRGCYCGKCPTPEQGKS